MDDGGTTDPRLRRWRERLSARAEEALDALAGVPGVVGLVLGGSYGRGQHWPLSDLDVIVVSAGRAIPEVAADVNMCAYQLSEMWGTSGIYTAVDAGRLSFDETEVRSPGDVPERMDDSRWLFGLDKIYGGTSHRDNGAAAALLELSTRWRFDESVVSRRIAALRDLGRKLLAQAERLSDTGDRVGAWIAVRRAAGVGSEIATEGWGERSGSLGRHWTQFEARARRHNDAGFADRLLAAARLEPTPAPAVPEWLADRIALSYEARVLIGESVTPEQNARDNLFAFAGPYRGRFPSAAYAWMAPPPEADVRAAIRTMRELVL